MPVSETEQRVADLMAEVYKAGGRFVMNEDKTRLAVRDVGDDLRERCREDRREIIEVLTGDPLEGIGWGVRTVFFRKACAFIDAKIDPATPAQQRAEKALYNSTWQTELSKLHLNGQFEEYRAELLRFARRVIDYAHSSEKEAPAFVG